MAQKSPYTLPQNGHFWGGLFYSLFCSNRSKWDSNCNCYFRPLLEKTFSRGLRYDRMTLLLIMLRLSHVPPLQCIGRFLFLSSPSRPIMCACTTKAGLSVPLCDTKSLIRCPLHTKDSHANRQRRQEGNLFDRDTVVTDY